MGFLVLFLVGNDHLVKVRFLESLNTISIELNDEICKQHIHEDYVFVTFSTKMLAVNAFILTLCFLIISY